MTSLSSRRERGDTDRGRGEGGSDGRVDCWVLRW